MSVFTLTSFNKLRGQSVVIGKDGDKKHKEKKDKILINDNGSCYQHSRYSWCFCY